MAVHTGRKLINENTIRLIITNDINNDNIQLAKEAYSKADKFMDTKFEIPTTNKIIMNSRNDIVKSLAHRLSEYIADSTENNKMNETQAKNFKYKMLYWIDELFKDIIDLKVSGRTPLVFIDNKVSKHEWVIIQWLFEEGVSFFILDKSLKNSDSFIEGSETNYYTTSENLNYKTQDTAGTQPSSLHTLEEVESALEDEETLKLIIQGTTEDMTDTKDFYARVNNKYRNNSDAVVILDRFDNPTYEELQSASNIKLINDTDCYIASLGLSLMHNIKNIEIQDIIRKKIEVYISNIRKETGNSLSKEILYNRIVNIVLKINRLFINKELNTLVFFGIPLKGDKAILEVLAGLTSLNILVIYPDKIKDIELDGFTMMQLPNSSPMFKIPKDDTQSCVVATQAVEAEKKVNNLLYNGDTLGMYKPGYLTKCRVILFKTTYDEIALWWNNDMYLRPGFSSNQNKCTLPCMFKVIKGVKGTIEEYIRNIYELSKFNTLFFKTELNLRWYIFNSDMDIDKIKVSAYLNDDNTLNREALKDSKYYKYGFLSEDKQNLILNAIDSILTDGAIKHKEENKKFNKQVLTLLLSLHKDLLRIISSFEYYSLNSNIILMLNNEDIPDIQTVIWLRFLWLIGFDVLVLVPTSYIGIESHITEEFMYDEHVIGPGNYEILTQTLQDTFYNPKQTSNQDGQDKNSVQTITNIQNAPRKKGTFRKFLDWLNE